MANGLLDELFLDDESRQILEEAMAARKEVATPVSEGNAFSRFINPEEKSVFRGDILGVIREFIDRDELPSALPGVIPDLGQFRRGGATTLREGLLPGLKEFFLPGEEAQDKIDIALAVAQGGTEGEEFKKLQEKKGTAKLTPEQKEQQLVQQLVEGAGAEQGPGLRLSGKSFFDKIDALDKKRTGEKGAQLDLNDHLISMIGNTGDVVDQSQLAPGERATPGHGPVSITRSVLDQKAERDQFAATRMANLVEREQSRVETAGKALVAGTIDQKQYNKMLQDSQVAIRTLPQVKQETVSLIDQIAQLLGGDDQAAKIVFQNLNRILNSISDKEKRADRQEEIIGRIQSGDIDLLKAIAAGS